jgi:hypothetical protein
MAWTAGLALSASISIGIHLCHFADKILPPFPDNREILTAKIPQPVKRYPNSAV